MSKAVIQKEPSKWLVLAAFAALYIIWGSTYLGISIAITTIPPFFLVGTRFLLAGAILYIFSLSKGERSPSIKGFGTIGLGGVLMLFMGNGAVSYGEQYLPTGLVAIIVATVPLWFVLLDKAQWKYYFSNKLIILGFFIGFGGVMLLFAGNGSTDLLGDKKKLIGFFVLLCGSLAWATGSLYSKYRKVEASAAMKASVQMLMAGVVSVIAGFIAGEQNKLTLDEISWQSITALFYLIIMGSLIGYMSYIWLLSIRPASVVGTFAYVNPVVAVFLGWLVLDEQISKQQIIALVVILAGVIMVNFAPAPKKVIIVSKSENIA